MRDRGEILHNLADQHEQLGERAEALRLRQLAERQDDHDDPASPAFELKAETNTRTRS